MQDYQIWKREYYASSKQLKFLGHMQIWVGIIAIPFGCLEVVFGSTMYNSYSLYYLGSGIWGGLFIGISGILSRIITDYPIKSHVVGGLVMAVLSMVITLAVIGISITGLVIDYSGNIYIYNCISNFDCIVWQPQGPLIGLLIIHAIIIITHVTGFACATAQVAYLSKIACIKRVSVIEPITVLPVYNSAINDSVPHPDNQTEVTTFSKLQMINPSKNTPENEVVQQNTQAPSKKSIQTSLGEKSNQAFEASKEEKKIDSEEKTSVIEVF